MDFGATELTGLGAILAAEDAAAAGIAFSPVVESAGLSFSASQLAGTALALQGLGTAGQVYGNVQGANAARAAADYRAQVARNNAEIAKYNADYARMVGESEASKIGMESARLRSRQKVAFAASGVDPNKGTPKLVEQDTKALGDLDAYTIRNNAARRAYGFERQGADFLTEADLEQASGKSNALASYINAAGNILGGAASTADKWSAFKTKGVFA